MFNGIGEMIERLNTFAGYIILKKPFPSDRTPKREQYPSRWNKNNKCNNDSDYRLNGVVHDLTSLC